MPNFTWNIWFILVYSVVIVFLNKAAYMYTTLKVWHQYDYEFNTCIQQLHSKSDSIYNVTKDPEKINRFQH